MTVRESPTAFIGPFSRPGALRKSVSIRSTPIPGVPGPVENEVPISQLPLAGPTTGSEEVAMVQNGVTCRGPWLALSVPGPPGPRIAWRFGEAFGKRFKRRLLGPHRRQHQPTVAVPA